jgi:tRNA(fMet)-specific endonuclease VapC
MSFLLDTNIVSAHVRRPGGLAHRFIQHAGRLHVPSIVLAELYAWAYRKDDPTETLAEIADLLTFVQVVDFDAECAHTFGQLRGTLLRAGTIVSTPDLWIASVALTHDLTLVTNNTKHFVNIPGLRLVDWLTP